MARAAAGFLSLLAVIKLAEFFTGAAVLNLEAALVSQPGDFDAVPLARMSPWTAMAFLGSSLALALLAGAPTRAARNSGGIVGGVVIPMAPTTGLAFMGSGLALVMLAGPAGVPLRPFCGRSARARLLRVFLPLTVVAVLLHGILTDTILAYVPANPALLAAVFALVFAAIAGAAVSWSARALGRAIDDAEVVMQRSQEELEQRVHARTAELHALTRELESFSYAVSHDLRAPLRAIRGFSQVLLEDHADRLDEAGLDCLHRVHRAAGRMGELIEDLLKLSRLAGRAVPAPDRPFRTGPRRRQ